MHTTRVNTSPLRATTAAAAVALACLAGCASPGAVDAQWSAPQLPATPLHGARVLVVCESGDEVLSRLCLDRLAAELQQRGLTPVTSADVAVLAPGQGRDDTRYLGAARAVGAGALWVSSVGPDAYAGDSGGSGLSIGIGGFSIGRSSSVGVGVAMPVGGTTPTYAADARVSDVASGRLLWTARAGAGRGGDARGQVDALLVRLVDAADKLPLY
jgi:hypothetical protein